MIYCRIWTNGDRDEGILGENAVDERPKPGTDIKICSSQSFFPLKNIRIIHQKNMLHDRYHSKKRKCMHAFSTFTLFKYIDFK